MWVIAPDKRVEYAEEVYSVDSPEDRKALSLLCPTRKIHSRGGTLNHSTLNIDLEVTLMGSFLLRLHTGRVLVGKVPTSNCTQMGGRPTKVLSITSRAARY